MRKILDNTKKYLQQLLLYGSALLKWLVLSTVVGFACGLVGSSFDVGVDLATEFRLSHPWILYLLPAGAVVAVLVPNDGGAIWTSAKSAIGRAVRSKTMMIAKLIRGFPFWGFGLLDFVIAGLL